MIQDIFEHKDYKVIIKDRVHALKKAGRPLTLQKMAAQIPVQSTYLSKVLNNDSNHLNDDHLFQIAQILKLDSSETDYLIALKDLAVSQSPARRKFLADKIDSIQKEKRLHVKVQTTDHKVLSNEANYLFDPTCLLVYVALSSSYLRQKSSQLAAEFGLGVKKYKQILQILEQNEMIELGSNFEVKRVLKGNFHLGRNHPLMRAHQNIMKSTLQSKLQHTDEDDKYSFLATFTSDPEGFKLIQQEFNTFLKKVEKICTRSEKPSFHRNVFQLNFDLLKWM